MTSESKIQFKSMDFNWKQNSLVAVAVYEREKKVHEK